MRSNSKTVKQQHGFTIIQMVITIAIIAVVSVFGVLGIRTARAEFRQQNSARLFASYIEKARADSVRRHAAPGSEASVEIFGAGTSNYAVTMDFGSGTVETRTFYLDPGIEFDTAAQKVTFNWRGRLTTQCPVTLSCVFQVRSPFLLKNVPVDVSGSGDITVEAQHFPDGLIPAVEVAQVDDSDVDPEPVATPPIETPPGGDGTDPVDSPTPTPTATPTATPTPNGNGNGNGNGSDNGNNGNGNPTPTPTATPTPTPSASASPTPVAPCTASISPSTLTLSQSDSTKQTGTATYTMSGGSGARIISAAQDGSGNSLVIALSLARIDGSGSSQISVTTKHGAGNRGTFLVKVSTSPTCGSTQTLTVIVNN